MGEERGVLICSRFEADGEAIIAPMDEHWLAPVFEALDNAATGPGNVSPGTIPSIWRTLEKLRREGASPDAILRTEALLVALHKLQAALRRPGVEGRELTKMLRGAIRTLSYQWLLSIRMA